MVVTHELVVEAAGPEGTMAIVMALGARPDSVEYMESKVADAYKRVFETDAQPNVASRLLPALEAAA